MNKSITREEIVKRQNEWGQCVVEIGTAFLQKENFKIKTEQLITEFYGYGEQHVLFKPTKAREKQFRLTYESAVSYFIGANAEYDEDKGFALTPWVKVRFENRGFLMKKDCAFVMGNYFFTNLEGEDTQVEFTIGFFRSKSGALKINLHHSSIPYQI